MTKKLGREIFLAGLLYLLIGLILFFPAIVSAKSIYFGDNYYLLYPQKLFFRNTLSSGVVPYWNPYLFGGIPFLADINHSAFYPLSILFIILSPVLALNFTVFLHFIVSGLGTFFASRALKQPYLFSLIAGVVWILSEFMLSAASSNLAIFQSNTWLPWIGLCLILSFRSVKYLVFLPLFISLSTLGGHPQLLAFLLFFSGIYFLVTKKIKILLGLCLSLVITAIINIGILVPFVELSGQSTRLTQAWDDKTKLAVDPKLLIQFVIPTFFSDVDKGIFWGPEWDRSRTISGYATLIIFSGCILLFFTKKTSSEKFVYFIGLISVLFSLGNRVSFLWDLIQFIPGINGFRNPSALIGLTMFSISVLSGQCIVGFEKYLRRKKYAAPVIITISLLTLVSLLVVRYFFNLELWNFIDNLLHNRLSLGGFHTYERDKLIFASISGSLMISLFFLLASVIVLKNNFPKWLLLVFVSLDLLFSNHSFFRFGSSELFDLNSSQGRWLTGKLDRNYRILSSSSYFPYVGLQDYWNNALFRPPFSPATIDNQETRSEDSLKRRANNLGGDWNLAYSVPLANGYGAFVLKNTAKYWDNNQGYIPINDVDKVPLDDFRISDQGIKYITVDTSLLSLASIPFDKDRFPVVHQEKDVVILENLNVLPIVRFANNPSGKISLINGNVNQIIFDYASTQDDMVLVKQTYYPGWKCTIDDQETCTILEQDSTMKIQAPSGNHHVHFEFTPTGWPYIGYLSVLFWIAYIIILRKYGRYGLYG